MSQDNQITLRGFVTAEPKFRQTALTATPMTEIRLGSTPRRLNRETGEWQDQPTSYFTVKCWRRLAVNASSSLKKGDVVIVRGRFYTRTWLDKHQRQQTVLEIEADTLGHDLSFGWSHFLRGSRPVPGGQTAVNAGELERQGLGDRDESGGDPDGYAALEPGGAADLDDPGYSGGSDYPGSSDYPGGSAYPGGSDYPGESAAVLGRPTDGDGSVPETADALDRVPSDAKSDITGSFVESAPF